MFGFATSEENEGWVYAVVVYKRVLMHTYVCSNGMSFKLHSQHFFCKQVRYTLARIFVKQLNIKHPYLI